GDPRPALVIRQLDELLIAAEPERWAALGLAVGADGVAQVGTIRLRLGAPGEPGIAGWRVRGLADGDLDGLPTQGSAAPPRAPAPSAPGRCSARRAPPSSPAGGSPPCAARRA